MHVRHKQPARHYFNQSCVLHLKRQFGQDEIRQSVGAIGGCYVHI